MTRRPSEVWRYKEGVEWVFSGIGTAIIIFLLGLIGSRVAVAARKKRVRQAQKAGDNAIQVQSGRDSRIDSHS
jgi:hypothetical protein